MKYISFVLFIFLCTLAPFRAIEAVDWQEVSGEHFIVYYAFDDKFAKDVAEKSEVYYRQIATDIGYPRYSEFWTWDKRVKIYIYPDHASYLSATNQPKWSQGMADYKNKQIVSYAWSRGFVESLLPHEMAHLIFRDFVGFKGEVPLWLDEGVAQWAEQPKRSQIKAYARHLFANDQLLSVEDMMKLDVRRISEQDRLYIRTTRTKKKDQGVLFLSGDTLVSTYYLQSVLLVGFLIEKFGSDNFAEFCRQLREGKGIEEAFRFAYPTHIRSVSDLEERWREYLEKAE
jgi:hypothetical protein